MENALPLSPADPAFNFGVLVVLGYGAGAQVGRVYAAPHSAPVKNAEFIRQLAIVKFERKPVCPVSRSAFRLKSPVPIVAG